MRKLKIIIGVILVLVVSVLIYGYFIEPQRLLNEQVTITSKNHDQAKLKIVQFSDIHISSKTSEKYLQKIQKMINKQNPDIIIFTGDLYDNYEKYHDNPKVIRFLKSLHAKQGKLAVYGNHDSGGGGRYPYSTIMEQSDFDLLVNNSYTIEKDDKKITFYGLDDSLLGNPEWQSTTGDYKILISHEPELFYQTDADLLLSGHTHGGQVQLSFLEGKTNLMGGYVRGLYKKDNQYHYIDSGIGMTRMPFRIGVPPQISTITIRL